MCEHYNRIAALGSFGQYVLESHIGPWHDAIKTPFAVQSTCKDCGGVTLKGEDGTEITVNPKRLVPVQDPTPTIKFKLIG